MTARRTLAALASIGILFPASRVEAVKLDITPSISLNQSYDSNVFNTNGNEKEDFILRATPAVTFAMKVPEPETILSLRASLTSATYFKNNDLSNTTTAVTLGLDGQPQLKISPRFSISPSGHYVQSQDSFQRTQLVPSGDPLIPSSIASETATRKTRDYGAALRVIYLVTPKTDFSVGGGFSKREFLDNVTGEFDSRVLTGDSTLKYRFTPLFSSGFFFNMASNTFENGRDSRTISGGLTGTYLLSPALTTSARVGASRTKETENVAGLPDRTDTSPSGSLSVTYTQKDFRAALTGSVDQSGGGSFGFTTRRRSVNLSFADRFAPEWTADLFGSFQENRSLDPGVTQDLTSATGTAGVGYQPTTWATFRLSGTAFRQWSNGSVGSDLKRYSAFLGITLGYTYNIY